MLVHWDKVYRTPDVLRVERLCELIPVNGKSVEIEKYDKEVPRVEVATCDPRELEVGRPVELIQESLGDDASAIQQLVDSS